MGTIHKCMGCPDRVADPNCHHPDRCEYWAKVEEERKARYERRRQELELEDKDVHYKKHCCRGAYQAYFGTGNNFRKPKGHTILRGGETR